MKRKRGLAGAGALAALALVLALAGCGGGGDSDGVASLGGSAQSGGTTTGEQDPEEAALEFAKCMREHGIDFPDPDPNGGFELTPDIQGDPEDFRKAEEACGSALQGRPGGATPPQQLSEEDRAALQDATLAFAKCMREHGIDMPDPDSSGPGGGFSLELPKGLSPDDPTFKEAQKACEPILQDAQRKAGLEPPGASS